ncbi:hypothetical protein BDP27DRAFT_1360220 [Rhodocollybia butyracea]|uniref:LysM domain-containing protein n=1 Tax=Rhodocollybia butyracea TaxID=206335 RepID=A0A9P5UBZ8_9AGAR|nr:hypothetical protein BDP27DRAFT_1360220 [Rhodocollybia butyracea]
MFAHIQLVAWATALGSMTHVFAQSSSCATNYTVQEGDICSTIASQFNVTIVALETANPQINSDCTNLDIGEVLCIPAAPTCPSGVTYVVQSGDVCINIANMFNTTVEALDLSNPQIDANCDNLFVGEVEPLVSEQSLVY